MANPLNPMHVFAHLLGGGTPQGIPGAIPSSGVPADLFGGIPRSGGLFDTGDVGNDNVGSQRDAQGAQSSGDQGAGYAVPPGFQGFTGAQRGQRTGQQGYAMPDNGQFPQWEASGHFGRDVQSLLYQTNTAAANANRGVAELANLLSSSGVGSGGRQDAAQQGYRGLKPKKDFTKITAESPKKLMQEIYQLEIDFGEIAVRPHSESGYRHLKAQSEGKAREIIDLALVEEPDNSIRLRLEYGKERGMPQRDCDVLGGRLYMSLVAKLEDCVRLTPEKRQQIAFAVDHEARMHDDTPAEAEVFYSVGEWLSL